MTVEAAGTREVPRLGEAAEPQARLTDSSSLRPEPSAELLARCRGRDPEAFAWLFETYKDSVYSLAFHVLYDESAAADVVQEVFLKLIQRIDRFAGRARFSSWLYRVVLNASYDQLRARRSARRFKVAIDQIPAWVERLEPVQPALVEQRERAHEVRRAVARLSPRLRSPLLLRHVLGLSYGEIAAALEITAGTVASRLSRAHRKIERELGEVDGDA